MSISRRKFFRGLVRQGENSETAIESRRAAIESYVRTNLLPYDFALTPEQTLLAISSAQQSILKNSEGRTFTYEERAAMYEAVEATVGPLREQHSKAEDNRRHALDFVREFLRDEANPEDCEALRRRFHIPYPAVLEDEVERQARIWLSGLSDVRLSSSSTSDLRNLVFSELRSWC